MSLREKLERMHGYMDEADDENKPGSGGAEDENAVQPEPGESAESFEARKAEAEKLAAQAEEDDKGDKVVPDSDDSGDKKGDEDDEPKGIPKSRLDSALKRARDAESELRKLRQEQAATPAPAATDGDDDGTYTIAEAEKRVADLDGEIAKALRDEEKSDDEVTKLLREQRELQEAIHEARVEDERASTRAHTSEEIQFDRVVSELEEQIPLLNPEHDDYNEDLVSETITLAQALHGQGTRTQADSMLLAVDYMSDKLGIKKDVVEDVKKTTNVEKNVETAKKMPPDLPGAPGTTSDKGGLTGEPGDAVRMTDAEFDALTQDEQKLKQLRGDFG